MFNIFIKNPVQEMQSLVDRASRIGIAYLEEKAVEGTITESMIETVARTLNTDFDELIAMIPDRRRPARHVKAMQGLRKAKVLREVRQFEERE